VKFRQGYVSNSSSASFVVGIPSTDREDIIKMLYNNFEYDFFGKYYLKEAIKKNIEYAEERLKDTQEDYDKTAKIPKAKRVSGKNNYDPLEWKLSSVKQWQSTYDRERGQLETLEEIDEKSDSGPKALVEFGLEYYGICFSPTFKSTGTDKSSEDEDKKEPLVMSGWDKDATDDRDITFEPLDHNPDEIIGYQLSDWVTMFNDFGDMPRKLRSMTGVLSFVYNDLKCWVEEDEQ